jgi:hypothetical protein
MVGARRTLQVKATPPGASVYRRTNKRLTRGCTRFRGEDLRGALVSTYSLTIVWHRLCPGLFDILITAALTSVMTTGACIRIRSNVVRKANRISGVRRTMTCARDITFETAGYAKHGLQRQKKSSAAGYAEQEYTFSVVGKIDNGELAQ